MKLKLLLIAFTLLGCSLYSRAENKIIVDKVNCTLTVVNEDNDTIFKVPVCAGKNFGNKTKPGDHKTPEGVFTIATIEVASDWKDSKGRITGDYGPYFIRLKVPGTTHIGIHGTNEPESVGTRASMGCVRLHNEDLEELFKLIGLGMTVEILPDPK